MPRGPSVARLWQAGHAPGGDRCGGSALRRREHLGWGRSHENASVSLFAAPIRAHPGHGTRRHGRAAGPGTGSPAAAATDVVISELMYHAPDGDPLYADVEFIELANTGAASVDLAGGGSPPASPLATRGPSPSRRADPRARRLRRRAPTTRRSSRPSTASPRTSPTPGRHCPTVASRSPSSTLGGDRRRRHLRRRRPLAGRTRRRRPAPSS